MHIGLVGGIGPAATDYYYRQLIALARKRSVPLELTVVHADAPTLLANQASGDVAAQVEIFLRLADRLERAGAETVGVTAISGHFCIHEFTAASPLPVCSILTAVNAAVEQSGFKRLGILGTLGAMETRLYGGITSAEIVLPLKSEIERVHDAYLAMASAGIAAPADRATILSAGRRMVSEAGAEAVILAGTDLVLAVSGPDIDFEVVDCAGIHIDALAELAAQGVSVEAATATI
jgi:aspartate racemase